MTNKIKRDGPGQPTVMTDKTLQLLKDAFLMGCSDVEACLYAEIAPSTLYNYQLIETQYVEQKALWKENTTFRARKNLYNAIVKEGTSKDPATSKWFLERKRKQEFSLRQELTGRDGKDLPVPIFGGLSTQDDIQEDNSNNKDIPTKEKD